MKAIRGIIQLLGMIFLIGITFWFGFKCGMLARKYPEPFTPRIMSIIELQEAVGAEPDGKVGPNTIAKWDYAYANQEAAKFMTMTGGPE